MSPLIVPSETVRSNAVRVKTRSMPANKNIAVNERYTFEHSRQRNVANARLRPGLQAPHKMPERLNAHCSSK